MINILNRGFAQFPYQAFIPKVEIIIAQLTGNAYFPSTTPKVSEIQAQLDVLTNALTLPDPQSRDVAAAAARTTLEQMLDDLADNLELTANMDPVKLATTGFAMHQTPTQSGEAPEIPKNLRLKATGVTGEAQVLFDAAARARGYDVQTAPDPMAGPWTLYDSFSSSRGIVLRGFPRAKDLWVRVRALGPNNTKSGWSDPATILIN
ncbi:MAG: hypothetical protein ABI992_08715 [Chthoniobacterales bacterium]